MRRCEDYPCCGHGPAPLGDGGGCPDEQGRFDCVTCGVTLPRTTGSSMCRSCMTRMLREDDHYEWEDE